MLKFLDMYKERINDSKKLIERCFKNKKIEKAPLIFNQSPFYSIEDNKVQIENYFTNHYSALEVHIESIKQHLETIEDDYIPYLFPYYGVSTLASGFGGKVRFYKEKDPWLEEKVINDFKGIDKLKKPVVKEAGLMKNVFDLMKSWKKKVKDKIPLGHTDIQGPISICIDLMGVEKFFTGIIDQQKRIHSLLEIVTEYIIDSLNISYEIIGERDDGYFCQGIYIPAGYGKVRISEDNIVFLSAEICKEFLLPYIEKIFDELDGGIIHWCGDGYKNIGQVLKIKGLTGFNNCSMGDIDIIEKQNNISIKEKVIFQNEVILPRPEWFKKVNDLVSNRNIIHHFIVPIDNFGISFNGYEIVNENKINWINRLIEINKGK